MPTATSNHSHDSPSQHRRMSSSDMNMNAAMIPQMYQGYPNNSFGPFSPVGTKFHSNFNTNSTPCAYKTAETLEETSPVYVVACRNILMDKYFQTDCDEADRDAALQGATALTNDQNSYDKTYVHVAKRVHAMCQRKECNTLQAANMLTDSIKRLKRLE
mmetsp:Transcript_962/g.1307  ORF Transcript_962/g.1307 Transcript_962/m.1307 type:complete len:159 (+) Transcript_962:65-541(+)